MITKITEGDIDSIPQFVERLRHGDVRFLSHPDNINLARQLRRSSEYKFYNRFDLDREQRVLVQMGISLRHLEENGRPARLQDVRDSTLQAHGTAGLHFAQCIQSKIPRRIWDLAMDKGLNDDYAQNLLQDVLGAIDEYMSFVEEATDVHREAQRCYGRLNQESPPVFVIAAKYDAVKTAKEVADTLAIRAFEYRLRSEEDKHGHVVFYFFLDTNGPFD